MPLWTCGKSNNKMFLTTGNWSGTRMNELKGVIIEFSTFDRIESESLSRVQEG